MEEIKIFFAKMESNRNRRLDLVGLRGLAGNICLIVLLMKGVMGKGGILLMGVRGLMFFT